MKNYLVAFEQNIVVHWKDSTEEVKEQFEKFFAKKEPFEKYIHSYFTVDGDILYEVWEFVDSKGKTFRVDLKAHPTMFFFLSQKRGILSIKTFPSEVFNDFSMKQFEKESQGFLGLFRWLKQLEDAEIVIKKYKRRK